uniref:Uncharacterized protein n=1 Tax=Rhizophora mucronata TaxID=61149 RepID=A0A2P2QBJ2_RHIMU
MTIIVRLQCSTLNALFSSSEVLYTYQILLFVFSKILV